MALAAVDRLDAMPKSSRRTSRATGAGRLSPENRQCGSPRQGRDNQEHRRVAPRQSRCHIAVASDNQTIRILYVASSGSHPNRYYLLIQMVVLRDGQSFLQLANAVSCAGVLPDQTMCSKSLLAQTAQIAGSGWEGAPRPAHPTTFMPISCVLAPSRPRVCAHMPSGPVRRARQRVRRGTL